MTNPTIITVSGPPGSGTTTVCETIAESHDHEYIYAGDIFRRMADERDMTLAEFTELCETDDSIDRSLDERMQTIAEIHAENDTPLLLESRLAGWVAGPHADLRIYLTAPRSVRVERLTDSDRVETIEEMRTREESEQSRYRNYYGIASTNQSIYDIVVNTARWDEQTVIEFIRNSIDSYDPATDEGTDPLPIDPTVFHVGKS